MELIIAIAVITTALLALVALLAFSVSGIKLGENKLIATNLAQEGIEIVRNIRDSNWLSYKRTAENWTDGLGQGQWRVQYDQLGLLPYGAQNLKINSNGFYQYDSGANTPFYRKITIAQPEDNQIKVTSEITWQEKGRNQVIRVESKFYNWLGE